MSTREPLQLSLPVMPLEPVSGGIGSFDDGRQIVFEDTRRLA